MSRRTDEQILIDLVPPDRPIGNTKLRRALAARSWGQEKYWRVRQQLIEKGLLVAGKGYGGSVRRTDPQSEEQETDSEPDDRETSDGDSPFPVLKHVRFKNWKSFRDATLYVDPLTILIGTNASGKSNALDGIQFLHRTALGKELGVALTGDPNLSPLRGGRRLGPDPRRNAVHPRSVRSERRPADRVRLSDHRGYQAPRADPQ